MKRVLNVTQIKTVLIAKVINIICTGKIEQNRNSGMERKQSFLLLKAMS